MASLLTTTNIVFAIGIISVIFNIYLYFRNPQIKGEKIDALVAQQIKFLQESNDRRFSDIHKEIEGITTTSQNHIHTVETKMDVLSTTVFQLSNEVTKLSTIIDERIPKLK
jgi:hypothetical protein